MSGKNYKNYGGDFGERATDNSIQQNIPEGLNSPLGEHLDNMLSSSPNPTYGHIYGGAHGVEGFNDMEDGEYGSVYGGEYGGGYGGEYGGW